MHVHRGLLGWGLFLVLLGAVPVAVRVGALDVATVRDTWQLWPVLLIGVGLGLVLARTRLAIVGGLVTSITAGLIGGSILATGWNVPSFACDIGTGGSGRSFPTRTGSFGGTATVDLSLSCGDLSVGTAPGVAWTVSGTDAHGTGPTIDASTDRLAVESAGRSVDLGAAGDRWSVTLPTDPGLGLSIALNAGSARIDLGGAHVPKLGVSVNAGDLRLDLSRAALVGTLDASANAGSLKVRVPAQALTGSLSANAGSLELCVPPGTALRIRLSDNPLGATNFASRGLTHSGSDWVTPGFEGATTRSDLSASANVGAINLNPEDGCE